MESRKQGMYWYIQGIIRKTYVTANRKRFLNLTDRIHPTEVQQQISGEAAIKPFENTTIHSIIHTKKNKHKILV